ncbi:MAG: hypothetical protein M3380_14715 [Chloroflexota bacterium]|jgi:hypothetical protein|nr:hypothetical protein [Chloroflexota bacterium]
MSRHYRIRVKGQLDPSWSAWFDGLTITHEASDETVLAGPLPDQAALYGVLEKARNLNLTLVSVSQVPSSTPETARRL